MDVKDVAVWKALEVALADGSPSLLSMVGLARVMLPMLPEEGNSEELLAAARAVIMRLLSLAGEAEPRHAMRTMALLAVRYGVWRKS